MKTLYFKILALFCVVFIIHSCDNSFIDRDLADETPELKSVLVEKTSYIVVLEDSELNTELSQLEGYEKKQEKVKSASEKILKRAGVTDGEIQLVYGSALQGFSVMIPPGQLKKLQDDPSVKSVTEDKLITLDLQGTQEVTAASTQVLPWGINRVKGGVSYTGSHVIWIIDTGIDLDHPDLNVDNSQSANFVTTVSSPEDDNGHGTHCAGIAAAIDNSEGVIGVAAGATVVPVKVLNRKGSGYWSWIIAGVNHVAGHGTAGDVANMSLGGSYYEPINTAVINAAKGGILFSLAAGNESTNASTKSPASANHQNIYTISAMDSNDNFAYFSNYGNPPVDYCEPGVSIYSTYKGGVYATMSGTSMAAPHMAGILLLTGGGTNIPTDGTVNNDPDNPDDPIAVAVDGGGSSNQNPTADFTYIASELIVYFTDTSNDPDGTVSAWNWKFGDGSTSISKNPTHTYSAAGTYTVSLTVTDNNGATDEVSKTLVVSTQSSSVAPTFTTWTVANTSNPALKRVQITWSVADENGDLATVVSTLTDPDGKTVSTTTAVAGSTASGIHELSFKKGATGTYTVTTIVKDQNDNIDTETKTIPL